jgi:hypothetical protein
MTECDETEALQSDMFRLIRQTEELKRLNPSRTKSYEEQLDVALLEIYRQADKLK